jgi:hypothetical protein
MKGDFTRTTFDPARHYSRVLMQQGRVTIDADPNEQTDILLHYLRTLAADLIGPYAAPRVGAGFALGSDDKGKLTLGPGRYYVGGILAENEAKCLYSEQPDYPLPPDDLLLKEMSDPTGTSFWLYLDVWERHITPIEDASIREVALGGPHTCTRSKVVWQVKAKAISAADDAQPMPSPERARLEKLAASIKAQLEKAADPDERTKLEAQLVQVEKQLEALPAENPPAEEVKCDDPLHDLNAISMATMSARIDPGYQSNSPCVLSPQAKYRGTENHLYRVEIHTSGTAGVATFKWSRDNGSVAAAWLGTDGNDLRVSAARGFSAGCWVELLDDGMELRGEVGVLAKVAKVEGQTLSIDPTGAPALTWSEALLHPKVRRWDQVENGDILLKNGSVPIVESTATTTEWLDLEDGIQIQFAAGGDYRAGDYWLIPARVATGSIEWPDDGSDKNVELTPFGIEHSYAPLGFVSWKNKKLEVKSCGCTFDPLSNCFTQPSADHGNRMPVPKSVLRKPAPEQWPTVKLKPTPAAPAPAKPKKRGGSRAK